MVPTMLFCLRPVVSLVVISTLVSVFSVLATEGPLQGGGIMTWTAVSPLHHDTLLMQCLQDCSVRSLQCDRPVAPGVCATATLLQARHYLQAQLKMKPCVCSDDVLLWSGSLSHVCTMCLLDCCRCLQACLPTTDISCPHG